MPSANATMAPPGVTSATDDGCDGPPTPSLLDLALLDGLADHICVLDASGTILAVNQAWRDFAAANPPLSGNVAEGADYFAVCRAATGVDAPMAQQALHGLQAAARGELPEFALEYPCHSPETQRWFELRAVRVGGVGAVRLVLAHRNVTCQKQTSLALRASEERYRTVVEDQTEVICRFRADGTFLFVNHAYCRCFGKPASELLNRKWQPVAHAEDVPRIEAALRTLSPVRPLVVIENRVFSGAGEVRWMQFVNRGFFDTQGQLQEIQSVGRDITERKQVEEALQESHQRLNALIEASPLAVIVLDPAGQVALWNPAAERVFGWTRAEVAGRPLPTVLPDMGDEFATLRERVMRGEAVPATETRRRRKDGAMVEVSASFAPLHDAQGALIGTIGILADITARKRAEEAERAASRLLERTFASLDEAVFVVEAADRRVINCNDAATRMFGYRKEEMLGRSTELLHISRAAYEEFGRNLSSSLAAAGVFRCESSVRSKDGRVFASEHTVTEIRDDSGRRIQLVSVVRDISERKQAQRMLQAERQRFYDVLETLPVMVCLLTPDFHVVFANRSFRDRFGDTRGRRCYEYCFGRAAPCDFCEAYEVLKTGRPHHWEVAVPNGDRIEVYNLPFTDTDGTLMILEMDIDISGRRQAEEALRLANLYNRSLIEASLDPLVTIGTDGKITDVNAATEQATGCARTELVGTDFSDYFTEPGRAQAGYQQVFREGSVRDYALEIRHREGRTTPVLYNAAVYRNEAGEVIGVFAAARDITERKQSEEDLRRLARRLTDAEEAERRRLARELHDSTAQKIAGLIMSLGRIEDVMGGAGGNLRRWLDEAQALAQECARELRTTSHLLHPPLLDEMGLEVALDTYIAGFSQRSGIQVQTELPPDLGRLPAEQEMALFRVVQESLGNIHRHSGSETACVQLTRFPERVVLEVHDRGRGIPEERLRLLRERASAFGVGMAGMQERLCQLGGVLEVDSTPDGTTVRAILPLARTPR